MNNYLSSNLRYLRNRHNKTLKDLAKILDKSDVALYYYETGSREPNAIDLYKLSEYYNVDIDTLLTKDLRFDNISPVRIDKDVIKIPVLGVIPAGVPIEAIEDVLDYEEIPKDWCKGGKEFFGLKIKGDSMFPKYIDNDVVIFEKTNDFNNGDECAVMVNGDDCTFKKVLKHEQGITLQPLNSAYDIKMYSNEDIEKLPIKIIGVAREMRRKL